MPYPVGKMHPFMVSLGNLTPCPIFICSEQYIQAHKASFCGDTETLEHILQAQTPLACKNLGKEVKDCNIDKWNNSAREERYPWLLEKSKQNPGLTAFLKSTGDKTLLECCYDETWGNGIPLTNPQCIDPNSYKKQGILEQMLEWVCLELNTTHEAPPQPRTLSQPRDTTNEMEYCSKKDLPVQT